MWSRPLGLQTHTEKQLITVQSYFVTFTYTPSLPRLLGLMINNFLGLLCANIVASLYYHFNSLCLFNTVKPIIPLTNTLQIIVLGGSSWRLSLYKPNASQTTAVHVNTHWYTEHTAGLNSYYCAVAIIHTLSPPGGCKCASQSTQWAGVITIMLSSIQHKTKAATWLLLPSHM